MQISVDTLLARAQVGLAFLFAAAFVGLILLLCFSFSGVRPLSQEANTLLTGLLGVMGTIVTLQQNYFFARHRPQDGALPDGNGDSHPNPIKPQSEIHAQ